MSIVSYRKLNKGQRQYLMDFISRLRARETPFYHFISGSAGVGKSVLINAVYQSLLRVYREEIGTHDQEVLLLAPTGKAAHNIGGMTLHTAFSLPINLQANQDLSASVANTLASKLYSLKTIIVDECSMVGAKMFNMVDCRLRQILQSTDAFGGVNVILFGDFQQFPPVMDRLIFQPISSMLLKAFQLT
jgi:ATP-dependent exoDNAse (exonuclease V) alpha subunit